MIVSLFLCLALTLAAEGLAVLLLTRSPRLTGLNCLGNLVTNPAVNLSLWAGVKLAGAGVYYPLLAALEIGAAVFEAWIFFEIGRLSRHRSVALSLVCNALSFGLGRWLLLWIKG